MPPRFEHDDEHEYDLVADLGVSFERSAFCASVVNFPRSRGQSAVTSSAFCLPNSAVNPPSDSW